MRACRSAAQPITASVRRSTCATRTEMGSSSTAIAHVRSGHVPTTGRSRCTTRPLTSRRYSRRPAPSFLGSRRDGPLRLRFADLGVLDAGAPREKAERVAGEVEDQAARAIEMPDPAESLHALGAVGLDRPARPERVEDWADDEPRAR